MKVKIFYGHPVKVEEWFNKWAKGKALSRNVIIHTVTFPSPEQGIEDYMAIVIYYPEGLWPEEETEEQQERK